MKRKFGVLFSFLLLLSSCTSKNAAPPDSGASVLPVLSDAGSVVIIPDTGRKDLPSSFVEVRLDDWSFGVPNDFVSLPLDGGNTLAVNQSSSRGLSVSFEKTPTTMTDLHQYVLIDFVLLQMSKGAEILQERTRTADNVETVAVQVLQPKTTSPQISSLDFFRQNGKMIYHLSCYGDATALQSGSDICFQIENTLVLQ